MAAKRPGMRDCHNEIIHDSMGFGILIHRSQIGFRQTFPLSPLVDEPNIFFEIFCTGGIIVPLKVLELELLDSLSWVFVVGFVIAMVVMMGDWLAIRTW